MALLDFTGSPHGGSHKLLPEWNTQPRITPVLIIDHTIVGTALGAWWYFHDVTGVESHFIIRGRQSGAADGHIWQLMDTDRQADANLQANPIAISVEHEDNGHDPIEPKSTAQLESDEWLFDRLARIHPGIKRVEATDCNGPGLAWHAKLGAPSCWTPAVGKTCPGAARIVQHKARLLPAFINGPQEDDTMSAADVQALKDYIDKKLGAVPDAGVQGSLSTLAHGDPGPDDTRNSLDSIAEQLKDIAARLPAQQ